MFEKIISSVRARVRTRKEKKPLSFLKEEISGLSQPRDFINALTAVSPLPLRIIAEIKRASPSAGSLNPGLSPALLSQSYQKAGACAISVLTEEDFFRGNLNDLSEVKKAVTIPVIQKEFILEPYQIYESHACGADAILLIVALHSQKGLQELYSLSLSFGLTPLVEIHNESELEIALSVGAKVIGINNRDLKTLTVDIKTSYRILPLIPKDKVVVVESGLKEKDDLIRLKELGASAFLIGEILLRSPDPASTLSSLIK
ncbi:MAG: indole-3-glycerol phosphate synthase TrpC [Candidatus Omnitrophota bacterium]